MASEAIMRAVRAGAWFETDHGRRYEVNLIDNPNVRELRAEMRLDQPPVEKSSDRPWREYEPGPYKFARIVLDGLVSESKTERMPTPVRLIDDKTRAALIALGWKEPEEER